MMKWYVKAIHTVSYFYIFLQVSCVSHNEALGQEAYLLFTSFKITVKQKRLAFRRDPSLKRCACE